MPSNQNEENNDKRMSSRKNKKSINRLQIFSKNDSNKNLNNNNNNNINLDKNISKINNINNKINNLEKKLKLNKKISNNLVVNKDKEIKNDNIIEKYNSFSNSNKEIREKKLNSIGSEQNNNELIPKRQKSVGSNNDTTKKESKNESNNIKTKSKTIEKSENLFEDISQISKTSTAIKDSSYYMEKSKKLINYIKEFYIKNNKYPDTKINFYLYGRRIGQGAFGKVNLGLNVLTGRVVAIKSFKKTKDAKHNSNMNKILYETGLMKRFNHPNITKILEVFHDEEYMLIIMEYINGGNLFNFVKKRRKLSEKTAKFLFRQIILGIKHIHSQNIVHRDIKLENIIIDLNNNVKICDFGIGKVINSEDELLYDKCGTPMYMAPEIILSNKKNGYKGFPVDIWSSGITLYIMLSGTLPFTVKNKSIEELSLKDMKNKKESSDLKYQIVNGCPKKIKKISSEAKDLLNGLLNKNPDKRLTCDEILNHPWLKDDINEICDNNKYHLFTKAEMTMMSKTYIDYRKGELEDLRENFTITNLKSDEIRIEEKNISTKSSILAPFNSALNSSSYSSKKDKFDDSNNSKINLENDLIIYNNKVKEYNLNYELNNNQEVDNGMLIKTKSDISSLISDKNSSVISHNDEKNKREKDNNISFESKTILNKIDTNTNENGNYINENNPKTIKILDEIENFGYKKEYVINCVKNNILCHASTIYYLLKNYGDID
jgi:serine/threonine protein kinase